MAGTVWPQSVPPPLRDPFLSAQIASVTRIAQVISDDLRRRARAARRVTVHLLFERRLELDTDGELSREELGTLNHEYEYYGPSQWLTLRTALLRWPPTRDDVFIDIGSGKGRVVIQAARYPFRRVIGVELSPLLSAAAKQNLERNRHRLACTDVELVTADITNYELPPDVTIAYCYHALTGRAFQRLVEQLVALADRRGEPVLFIYSNPVEHAVLMAGGHARLITAYRARLHLRFPLHIYEILPSHSDHATSATAVRPADRPRTAQGR